MDTPTVPTFLSCSSSSKIGLLSFLSICRGFPVFSIFLPGSFKVLWPPFPRSPTEDTGFFFPRFDFPPGFFQLMRGRWRVSFCRDINTPPYFPQEIHFLCSPTFLDTTISTFPLPRGMCNSAVLLGVLRFWFGYFFLVFWFLPKNESCSSFEPSSFSPRCLTGAFY